MKILVTGGAGYIGSHTVKELIKHNYEVVIFDNLSTGRKELVKGRKLIIGDLKNINNIRKVFKKYKFDAVMHFASLIQVGESFTNPMKYYRENILNSLNLLKTMLEAGVKYFIFSSSAAVYGVPKFTPITEDHPLNPINPYGETKFFVEKMLQNFDRAYDLKYISLRYFNAAGADPEGELGELHDPETHLIPNILLFLLGKKGRFEIYGNDFPTPDGTAIRDYIHVTDLAKAHVLALKKLIKTQKSGVYNLGMKRGYSVLEVVKEVEKVTGKKVKYIVKPRRKGDVPILIASDERARKELNWKPQYSDLRTIIQTAWTWHRKFF
jgi:UDP-glucose 4-epimerase